MYKWIGIVLLFFFFNSSFAADKAYVLTVNGAISPATQDYIQRGILDAQKNHAKVIIIELNTPGGLETSMRGVNEAIISSPLPVITYVAPPGARAASAGTFIMYASHLSAMAPGTNIGAASPVNLVSTDSQKKERSTEEKKAINDSAAYLRSLAELRGRNARFAEQAVRESTSLSANEAKQQKVIDEVANDYPDLLQKMDGHKVLVAGTSKNIQTKNLELIKKDPDWRYQFLNFITNPTVAYILLLVAIYGIFFELANPGLVLPGVAGIICLLLVLYAFQLMPINYAGLTLVLIGIAFMIFEVFVSSFGVIGIGGVIAFIIGSVMLFDMHDPNYHMTLTIIILMCIVTILFFLLVLQLAIRSQKKKIVTGKEALIGSHGVVLSVMNEQTIVRVLGEIWEAKAKHALNPGQEIRVTQVDGLKLFVEPVEKPTHQDKV